MSGPSIERAPCALRLVDAGSDPWRDAGEDAAAALASDPRPWQVLAPSAWAGLRERWPADVPVGLRLDNVDDPVAHAALLDRVAMVALDFPKWTDGRAYSQARLLRARLRFAGEVRARGDVLVDMLPLLARTGFDAAVLRADQRAEHALRALAGFPDGHYQGDALEPRPRFARG